ncbi:VIT domain-containing protein [Actinoplanes rectilineatus]|uniref:VIT domain-containing protein n=1 Tax=Actinoplanes rectilineatus TaxID=113571 RepID=UPI0005F2B1FA|nr:VIT domain-containing protein [Actinoplanes rectilineatus]
MIISVNPMGPAELERLPDLPDAGIGTLRTERGNLPLDRLDVRAAISGLLVRTALTTEFVNAHDTALEATYVFPLPDRAAVTGMSMTADDRTITAALQERGAAREEYAQAIASGQRASIAEEERPDVFTMRVGNIMPGERVTVRLQLVGPLPYEDGAATFRFPLVVAPRYLPGVPLSGPSAGDGQHPDTDAVPDASRISPPVLLPGFPHPLRLSVGVTIDPAGLELGDVRSSLHTVTDEGGVLRIASGDRADRDFVLRLAYAPGGESAIAVPDSGPAADPTAAGTASSDSTPPVGEQAGGEQAGTFQLTVLPPDPTVAPRQKDVVLLLDRSGSMGGWKMVAARRAAARVIDTLTAGDRFAVLTFDHQVDHPADLGAGLHAATDRNRFRAVEHLARADARGGTEILAPLTTGLGLLADSTGRDRVLVLVTDGQVGNEDQIVHEVSSLIGSTRVHTIGIDRAVNAGFLGRLATLGAGRAELVESEDRLDEAMEHIHRRIGAPVVTGLAITADGDDLSLSDISPARLPGLYPGVPLVVTGRYAGTPEGTLTVTGRTRDDQEFRTTVTLQRRDESAVTALWARAWLRHLEDAYASGELFREEEIVGTSLRFGVLCRFTAYVAVDQRVVNEGGKNRRVTQPVESPSGWEQPVPAAPPVYFAGTASPFVAADTAAFAGPPPPSPFPPAPPAPGAPPPAPATPSPGPGTPPTAPPSSPTAPSAAPPAGAPAPGRPSFAPPRAGSPGSGASRSGMPRPGPMTGPPAGVSRGFAGPIGRARLGKVASAGSATSIPELRSLATVEADRLRNAAGEPVLDRKDLLEDLASRLDVLIAQAPEEEVKSLRELAVLLRGDTSLEERWATAIRVLDEFAGGAEKTDTSETPGRKPFWKR